MDAIPNIGTKAAFELVMAEVLKRPPNVPEATQLLIGTLHMVEPNHEIIQKVWVSERSIWSVSCLIYQGK